MTTDPVSPKAPSTRSPISRRRFLQASVAFGAFSLLPSRLLWGKATPSERVNVAFIGIGNRGEANLFNTVQAEGCNLVALCDVDLEGEHTLKTRNEFPNVPTFSDFRVMFDKMADDIDAVFVCTPDHSHFSIAMLAMSLGKHVYVEKPLAHTFGQCERLIDMAERSGVVTQMGNQGHSGANYFQFKAWTEAGLIKDVTRITAYMNKRRRWHGWGADVTEYPRMFKPETLDWELWADYAPVNSFSSFLHPQEWRSWYDYGSGAFGDWGPHILDTAHRFLELGLPETIVAEKRDRANDLVFPQASTIRFDFPSRGDKPACKVTWYDGQDNHPEVEPELGPLKTDEASGKKSRGPVETKRPGKIIYSKDHVFQGGSHSDYLKILPEEKYMDMRRELPRFPQKNSNHYENFLLACKGEEESRSPFHVSGRLTQVFNLGVLSQRFGGTLKFDREKKTITNHRLAEALLDPAPRKEFKQYYNL